MRARVRGSLVAVGSGTLTDIVRYAAHLAGCEFFSVPTAARWTATPPRRGVERDGVS